ncbi:MAG: hypothetical protein LAT68_09255 [Cyclobacteriaceae bacterium]|nr:hypothetical protein [Cyclobacteriaceae bacterium]MCH8516502.1 hypothetical protein [Cyclobacteriaceae bacterium]
MVVIALFFLGACSQEEVFEDLIGDDVSLEEFQAVDFTKKDQLDPQCLTYFENMALFITATSSHLNNRDIQAMRYLPLDEEKALNPILEEISEVEIEDDEGNLISFYDLSIADRGQFLEGWTVQNAILMDEKIQTLGPESDVVNYLEVQNNAVALVLEDFRDQPIDHMIRTAQSMGGSNEIYGLIVTAVKEAMEKREEELFGSDGARLGDYMRTHLDPWDILPNSVVLSQLKQHAVRGHLIMSIPRHTWLSRYLFYTLPGAFDLYYHTGKYPPGHTSIITLNGSQIVDDRTRFAISARNSTNLNSGGVTTEYIERDWNCVSVVSRVRKLRWKRWGFRWIYPTSTQINNAISYAESRIGTPYCRDANFLGINTPYYAFITAKDRTNCFICTTITWRSYDRQGFNTHRVLARWMPTIAPIDIYLSSNVETRYRVH